MTGLETARFALAPIARSDRADLFAHLSDPRTVEHMDIEPLADVAGAEAIIDWAGGLWTTGEGAWWVIRDRTGAFVGSGGFANLVRERGSRGELSYNVVRARWRQGVMAEVLPVLLDFGFGALGLHRIEALVTPGNRASAGLLEKHAFVREGTLRDHAFWKGRFWDQWLYARLADQDPAG